MPVLSMIFPRHASNRYEAALKTIEAAGRMPKRPQVKGDLIKRRVLMLPEQARYDYPLKFPTGTNLGEALVEAMNTTEAEHTASGDVFGRIYEYFLMKFAMQGTQDKGEFFTPPSLVQTIVSVIEPDHGVVFDPVRGSGGMFVQSSYFIEHEG